MKNIIIVIFALCLFNSCDDEIVDLSSDKSNSSQMKSSSEKFVLTFYTVMDSEFTPFVPCNKNEEHWYQKGASVLPTSSFGEFTTKMNFCMDNFAEPSPGGVDEDGNPYDLYYPYRVVKGSFFFTESGDQLDFIVPKGEVRINYLGKFMWWDDTFIFTGGTGRFKGASGRGTTMANSGDGETNNHNWTGMIRLVK